jgi:hypothetical protein
MEIICMLSAFHLRKINKASGIRLLEVSFHRWFIGLSQVFDRCFIGGQHL